MGSYLIPVTLYDPAGNYADAELALTYQVDNTYTIALKDVTGNLVGNAEIVNGSDIVATVHLPYEDVTGSNKLNLVFYQDGEDGRMKAATAAAKLATGEGAVTVKNNVVTVPKRLPVLAEGETYDLVTTVSADNYNDARLTVKIIVDKAAITVTDVASSTTNSSYQTIAPAADGETYEADRFAYGENKYFRITSDSKSSAQFTAASLVSADEPETDLRDAYLVKESFAKGKSLIQLAPGLPTGDYELTLTGESSSSDQGRQLPDQDDCHQIHGGAVSAFGGDAGDRGRREGRDRREQLRRHPEGRGFRPRLHLPGGGHRARGRGRHRARWPSTRPPHRRAISTRPPGR